MDFEVKPTCKVFFPAEGNQMCLMCKDVAETPYILPCKHIFCKECLDEFAVFKSSDWPLVKCFVCVEIFQIIADDIKLWKYSSDREIIQSRSKSESKHLHCSVKDCQIIDNIFYCIDKQIVVCGDHKKTFEMENHAYKFNDIKFSKKLNCHMAFCMPHDSFRNQYCETCKSWCCKFCMISNHNTHVLKSYINKKELLNKYMESARSLLNDRNKQVKSELIFIGEQLASIKPEKSKWKDQIKDMKKKLLFQCVYILNRLEYAMNLSMAKILNKRRQLFREILKKANSKKAHVEECLLKVEEFSAKSEIEKLLNLSELTDLTEVQELLDAGIFVGNECIVNGISPDYAAIDDDLFSVLQSKMDAIVVQNANQNTPYNNTLLNINNVDHLALAKDNFCKLSENDIQIQAYLQSSLEEIFQQLDQEEKKVAVEEKSSNISPVVKNKDVTSKVVITEVTINTEEPEKTNLQVGLEKNEVNLCNKNENIDLKNTERLLNNSIAVDKSVSASPSDKSNIKKVNRNILDTDNSCNKNMCQVSEVIDEKISNISKVFGREDVTSKVVITEISTNTDEPEKINEKVIQNNSEPLLNNCIAVKNSPIISPSVESKMRKSNIATLDTDKLITISEFEETKDTALHSNEASDLKTNAVKKKRIRKRKKKTLKEKSPPNHVEHLSSESASNITTNIAKKKRVRKKKKKTLQEKSLADIQESQLNQGEQLTSKSETSNTLEEKLSCYSEGRKACHTDNTKDGDLMQKGRRFRRQLRHSNDSCTEKEDHCCNNHNSFSRNTQSVATNEKVEKKSFFYRNQVQ